MNDGEIFVFLGPSFDANKAKTILNAVYLPPARQADILSLVRNNRPKLIVLIDGEFGQSLSVWHKEIIFALSQGVDVYGASSMGALRAAELNSHGMKGFGQIYQDYINQNLMADDEVALIYGPAELNYPHLTIPMVNIRATLNRALDYGLISATQSTCIKSNIHKIFFADRTLERIHECLIEIGFSLKHSKLIFEENYVDQKAIDAEAVLYFVSRLSSYTQSNIEFDPTYCFDVMDQQDRLTRNGLRQREIAKYLALHHKKYMELSNQANNRSLALVLARMWSVEVTGLEADSEKQRFRKKFNLHSDNEFSEWLEKNDIDNLQFEILIKNQAIIRKLHSWLRTIHGSKENTQALLDYLRLTNKYSYWEERIFNSRSLAQDLRNLMKGGQKPDESKSLTDLLEHQILRHGLSLETGIDEWIKDVPFQGVNDLQYELSKSVSSDKMATNFIYELVAKIEASINERKDQNV